MSGESLGGVVEFRGIFVLGEPGCVEHFGELSRFLSGTWVRGGGDGVKVEGVEKGPFFFGG